jgi:hypothetical protein
LLIRYPNIGIVGLSELGGNVCILKIQENDLREVHCVEVSS